MRKLLCAGVFALLFTLLSSFPAAQEEEPLLLPGDETEVQDAVAEDGPVSGRTSQEGPEDRLGLPFWWNGVVVGYQGGMAVILPGGVLAPAQLYDQLGSREGGLSDTVVTRDGDTALVSNFQDAMVYFVDVSDPFRLAVKGSVHLPFFAEDIALSRDSKWALVTDGGSTPYIAVIDVEHIALHNILPVPGHCLNSVTFSPDDRTVLATDYAGASVETLAFDPVHGILKHMQSISTLRSGFRPVNAAISPGGTTAVVVGVTTAYLGDLSYRGETGAAFQICNGQLIAQKKIVVDSNFRIAQSVIFSPDGRYVYILGTFMSPKIDAFPTKGEIVKYPLIAPGTLGPRAATNILEVSGGPSAFYGVEAMAIDCRGRYLYVTHKASIKANPYMAVLDPGTLQAVRTQVPFPDYEDPYDSAAFDVPTGIAFPIGFSAVTLQ